MRATGLMVVVVVVLLGCGGVEGRQVSRCELKNTLEKILIMPLHWLEPKNLILAKVICDAEQRSKLRTSLVTFWSSPYLQMTEEHERQGTRFYGVFQLSDNFHCDSGSQLSLNLCKTDCRNFIDEDIDDDVACFANPIIWFRRLWLSGCKNLSNSHDFFAGCTSIF